MFRRNKVNAAALLCLGAFSALPALAQEQLERVEVTGSRIKSLGAVSNSPIASVGVEEIRATQAVAVEDIIRSLPSAQPAIGPSVNNGSGGGATIDLRNLTPARTLVLIDGRRFVPFDLTSRVDTNSVPLALLQRIDLVTGGASAVYGADAVAGVVNFVLKKNFQGFEASTSYGVSEKGDGARRRTDITMGGSFADGKGNAALSIGTTKTDPVLVGDRPWGTTTTNSVNGTFLGSNTTFPILISVLPVAGIPAGSNTLGTGNRQLNLATGRFDAYNAATGSYNSNPPNYFQTPLDRRQVTALGNYVINDHAEVYAQLFYTRSDVNSVLAATGTFGNTFQVPIGNPFIPEAARQQICSARGISAANCVVGNTTEVPMVLNRRLVEFGPRYNDFFNKTLQTTLGLKGDLVAGWTYDAYYISGESDQNQIRRNWGSLSKIQQALRATSKTACTNTANGCVPLNLFGDLGSVTPEMMAFSNLSAILQTQVKQTVYSGSVSGDLGDKIKSPWAASPIGMAFGAEQREMFAANRSDASSQIQNEVLGTGAPTPDRSGTIKLKEFFAEAQLPILENKPFARKLNAELGFRRTQFSTTSSTSYNTNKYGGEWEPVKGLRFRGMIQNATRAPNINELYAPQTTGLGGLGTDPCQGAFINPADASKAGTLSNLCLLTGVPQALIGSLAQPSSGQVNQLSGGNPNVGPEKAKTKTLGFVFEPSAVKNLLFSVDYYRIHVTDAISNPSIGDVIDGCYNAKFNPGFVLNASCALIGRNPGDGSFSGAGSKGIFTAQSNQGELWTSGYDLTVAYSFGMKDVGLDAKLGRLDLSWNVNTVGDNDFQATPVSIRRACKGYYSTNCPPPNFATKFNQRTVWTVSDFVFSYNWRYQSGMKVEPDSGTWLADFSSVPAVSYIDLAAVWNVNKNLRLNLSINNVTNKTPKVVGNNISNGATTNTGNVLSTSFDTVGRFYTLGATLKF